MDCKRCLPAGSGMRAARSFDSARSSRKPPPIDKCLAICAIAAPDAIQCALPTEPGREPELLRARIAGKCEDICGFGHGELARSVGDQRLAFSH
jgi:hypothetical protein